MNREPTRVPRSVSDRYGEKRLHVAFFQHTTDKGGFWPTVAIMIPEASDQLGDALREVQARRARLSILADTADQADQAAAEVTRRLPEHRRVSIARAAAGGWGLQ